MSTNNWGTSLDNTPTVARSQPNPWNSNQGWNTNSQFGQYPNMGNQPSNFYQGQTPQRRQGMSAFVYGLLAMFVPIPIIDIIWAWRGIKIANQTGDTPAKVVSIIGMIWSISFNLWFFGFVIIGMLILGSGLTLLG